MARDRQKAKQRQAERRARRLAQQGATDGEGAAGVAPPRPDGEPDSAAAPEAQRGADSAQARPAERDAPPDVPRIDDPRAANPAPGVFPDVAVGAPPEEVGRTDRSLRDEPGLEEDLSDEELEAEALRDIEDRELEPVDGEEAAEAYAPRGRRGDAVERAKDRPRFIQFLIACWAELQRVQWPNRQALTTLTGVVLGFVVIAGAYLGALDAIFSRLIQAIL
ncbi:MAG TPA: preprotein translocase subunit SecE [Thermoleophilaceae bacterium]|nr:preprotein translocase subunit SecE [Thermoleophilaceae bacterium]